MKAPIFVFSILGLSSRILASPLEISAPVNDGRNESIAVGIGYEPRYINFENKPAHHLKLARDAVADAYEMAYLARTESQGLVLARYFDEKFHDIVRATFGRIVDEKAKGQKRMENIKIDGDGESHTLCDPGARLKNVAVIFGDRGSSPTIFLCPSFFFGPTLGHIKLGDLGDRVTAKMDTVGAIMVHEFTHWDQIGEAATGTHITDHDKDGYGCYNCRFELPQEKHIVNADDFSWYSTENYWTIRNNYSLFRSPREQDNRIAWCKPQKEATCVAM